MKASYYSFLTAIRALKYGYAYLICYSFFAGYADKLIFHVAGNQAIIYKVIVFIVLFFSSTSNLFPRNFSTTYMFVSVCLLILDTLILPLKKAIHGIRLSARFSSTGAPYFISSKSLSAASFPTCSAFLPLSPSESAPIRIGLTKSISSGSFENIAHRVIPEPVESVPEYSTDISIGHLNFLSVSFAESACLSATSAFSRSFEA